MKFYYIINDMIKRVEWLSRLIPYQRNPLKDSS